MGAKAPTGEEARRSRVVKGWAFRDHSTVEKQAIRRYIATGDISDDLPESYKALDKTVT